MLESTNFDTHTCWASLLLLLVGVFGRGRKPLKHTQKLLFSFSLSLFLCAYRMTQWCSSDGSSHVSQPIHCSRTLSSLSVINSFCWGLSWSSVVFRESCHQDTPWLHISSILRTLIPFVTVSIALSLLWHWRALSLHATVPAVTKTGSVEGRDMLKEPEENCRFIREKINQVLFLWWTELASNRALSSVQRSDCGTVSRGRKYKVP